MCGQRRMYSISLIITTVLLGKESLSFSVPAPRPRVSRQIKRAKKLLIDSLSPSSSLEKHSEIIAAMDEGLVKPFFHTLLLPEVFLNNHRSCSIVTAGEVDEERNLALDTYGRNLDDVVIVDENGNERGACVLTDKGLGEAREFDVKQTVFAVDLVNAVAEMLGEDIECTKLSSSPIQINPRDVSYDLLTRPESRGVVADIIHRFAKEPDGGSVAAITGSPGIGKSWTLLYALQQALFYDGANVLFFLQKSNDAVMYIRRKHKIYAWTSKSRNAADSSLFKRLDVLVLLDPKEARNGGANFILGQMKLIYAASNNEDHFKNTAMKNNGDMQAFLGPPLDSEIDVILRRIDPSLTPTIIEERKKNVGNLIRYILDEKIYNNRIEATRKAVDECTGDNKLFEKVLQAEGMSAGYQTIPETLFKVLPTRPTRPRKTGYDGQKVLYRERVVLALSGIVRDAILRANRKVILSYWGRVDDAEYARMGNEAKKLFIKDLTNPEGMVMRRYLQTPARAKCNRTESELVVKSGMVVMKEMNLGEMGATVLAEPRVVARPEKGSKLIDAAGPGQKVYQVTMSKEHDMPFLALKHLLQQAGYIDEGGMITQDTIEKLEFYRVVPTLLASIWKEKTPHKYQISQNDKNKMLKECLNQILMTSVDQYVLPMTYENPITFSDLQDGKTPW